MEKHIQILKKLKALAERGIDGEKVNAEKILQKMLLKYNLTIEDIEGEKQQDYFFKAKGINEKLIYQIAKRINYDLKVYSFPPDKVKLHNLTGNIIVECTAAEFIEIDQMFDVYKKLYKKENDLFFVAFLKANDLLTRPPKEKQKHISDLNPQELEEWTRLSEMATTIKKETIRKQLPNQTS